MPILATGLLAAGLLLVVLVVLDLARKLPLVGAVVMAVYLPLAVNLPLLGFLCYQRLDPSWLWTAAVPGVLFLYVWVRLNVCPVLDGVPLGFRLKALGGATPLLLASTYTVTVQAVVLPLSFVLADGAIPTDLLVVNTVYSLGCCLVLYVGAAARAVLASKSLSVLNRVLVVTMLWIPVVGWVVAASTARRVRREYRAATDRVEWERTLPQDGHCATRYPILLVHGVGWRDHPIVNAWGRIPRYLKRHGATVFYGQQEAWGTIDQNGRQIASRIREITDQTGAPKINVIAHSRGGIDARYAITMLGMADRVASLTTMNTPHHGVRFADTATKLKEPAYRRMASVVNFVFGVAGDTAPDFFSSTMDFRTERSREFNRCTPDAPSVHYQSYTSVMSSASSDRVLSVPYRVIKALGEENDGLVSVDSARWGEFRGVFRSTSKRGVSHGDLVDMHREDYDGFNVLDAYLTIVADLKERGY